MKRLLFLLSLGFVLFSFKANTDTEGIVNALKQGSSEQLSKYFDNMIDLKLPEKDELKNVGKTQAGIALNTFFNDIGVKGFEVSSQGERGGTLYLTGKLAAKDKSYNVTIMMKSKGDKPVIITVRIN